MFAPWRGLGFLVQFTDLVLFSLSDADVMICALAGVWFGGDESHFHCAAVHTQVLHFSV